MSLQLIYDNSIQLVILSVGDVHCRRWRCQLEFFTWWTYQQL